MTSTIATIRNNYIAGYFQRTIELGNRINRRDLDKSVSREIAGILYRARAGIERDVPEDCDSQVSPAVCAFIKFVFTDDSESLAKLREESNNDEATAILLAMALVKDGMHYDYEEAMKLVSNCKSHEGLLVKTALLTIGNHYEAAAAVAKELSAEDDETVTAKWATAIGCAGTGNYQEGYLLLGDLHSQCMEGEDAEPQSVQLLNLRAAISILRGNYEDALEDLQMAAKVDNTPDTIANMACVQAWLHKDSCLDETLAQLKDQHPLSTELNRIDAAFIKYASMHN